MDELGGVELVSEGLEVDASYALHGEIDDVVVAGETTVAVGDCVVFGFQEAAEVELSPSFPASV